MVAVDYAQARAVFAHIRRPTLRASDKDKWRSQTLETFLSLGLGSAVDGLTLSEVPCANHDSSRGQPCASTGILLCPKCRLVKYCSGQCQRHHWPKHRFDCEHPMLDPDWQPRWVQEKREPRFHPTNTHPSEIPAYDCLRISHNETERASVNRDFKLCFAASGDIRNLIQTVNGLPAGYRGRCDILLNDTDSITVNKKLVILYALLGAGPSIEESAEIALHLMYSSALPPGFAAYLRGCVRVIYGDPAAPGGGNTNSEGEMMSTSFQCSLRGRGKGRIFSMQNAMAMRRPMEMLHSRYDLRKGMRSMKSILTDTKNVDNVDRAFVSLRPVHRLALEHFRRKGVLAPFSQSTRGFTEPNRLMYTASGEWLGHAGINPLKGWNVSEVLSSGTQNDVDPADIIGCLFFHIKSSLIEFARRMRDFHIDLYLTQFSPPLLCKGIAIGAFPAFEDGCFDRVDIGDLGDREGIRELLADWGPMLNRSNKWACLLMNSRDWHRNQPNASALSNPSSAVMLVERCKSLPSLRTKLGDTLAQGTKSPTLMRLLESLDAFVDHGKAFRVYLSTGKVDVVAKDLGLRVRRCNRVNPKRFGVSIDAPQQELPNLLRDEFYNLFTIGGGDLLTRFVEFEATHRARE